MAYMTILPPQTCHQGGGGMERCMRGCAVVIIVIIIIQSYIRKAYEQH